MPVIEPKDSSVKQLRGVHLWHDDLSSCSQRVRAVLAAKNVEWTSHLIEIPKGDNTKVEFLAINPKGLVPVLVHDGIPMTESIDIIIYLDQTFPSPPLRPADSAQSAVMETWLQKADAAQFDLKVLSHEFLFRAVRKVDEAGLQNLEREGENSVLVDFLRTYSQSDTLPEQMINESVSRTDAAFGELDAALEGRSWIVGDALSLADIAWMPNVHRMALMDWPFDTRPNLQEWHTRVGSLDVYQKALVDWEPPPARQALTTYALSRGDSGYHVRNFGSLRHTGPDKHSAEH